jgi:hypothetical protein
MDHHPGFSCPLCRSFHNLEADVEIELPEEDEEWEELPEQEPALNAASGENVVATEEDHEASAMMQDDLAAMDISDGNGNPRRSIDDDDDTPLGFQTAAEHNDRRLLPQGLNNSHPNNLNQTLIPSQGVPSLPPVPSVPNLRRPPRRGTMVQGQPGSADDMDQGFETDAGVVGYGAETDMDVDEPRHLGGHARSGSGSGRGRTGMYNQHVPNGSQTPHAAYSGSAGMSSAPNLLRPGSALGHTLTGQAPSIPGNSTPPGLPYHSQTPVNIRSNPNNQYHTHGMALSSSNPAAPRMTMPGSLPGSSTSHLLGDAGNGAGDRTMLGSDKIEDALNGEEHPVEGGTSLPGAFGFGSKRKR